jgi:hypothetical protein
VAGLGGLIGGSSVITQLFIWQVMAQVLGVLDAPFLQEAANKVNAAHPLVPSSPPDLAEFVVKNIRTEIEAALEAAMAGENSERFHHRVLNTGEPPGLEQVMEWSRRGFLPWSGDTPGVPSVENAIRTSRIYDYWIPVIQQAQFLPISVADAINAWVRGQVSETTALKYAYQGGIKEEEARILFHTNGRPASPLEALDLVRRGVIPLNGRGPDVVSFEQAIYEGDLKDKWEKPMEALRTRFPSVFQIKNAQASGGISAATAAKYYALEGIPEDLAVGLVHAASGDKLAGSKHLAQGVVEALYTDKFIDHAAAVGYLVDLGYDAHEAEFILDVVDYKLVAETETAAITKTKNAYLARHIDHEQARIVLEALGVPQSRQQQLMVLWEDERGATVRVLTEGQIVSAVYYGVANADWAMTRLQGLGYSAVDAWVAISVRMHGPIPNPPLGAPAPPPPPTPGTPTTPGG